MAVVAATIAACQRCLAVGWVQGTLSLSVAPWIAIDGVLRAWIGDGFWPRRQRARAVLVLLSRVVRVVLLKVVAMTFLSTSTVAIANGSLIALIIVATFVRLSMGRLVATAAAVLAAIVTVVRCPR